MSRVRTLFVALFVVAVASVVYVSNGTYLGSYDSAPNSLLAFDLLETGRIDFDAFRPTRLARTDAQYAFVEAPDGHLTSLFPIGAAIVSAPVYLAIDAAARLSGGLRPPIASPDFEPIRRADERVAAATIAALAVGLFLACALLLAPPLQAGIATAVFALCTPMWTIASQALWQHGPVNLAVLGMIYGLLRAGRSTHPTARVAWLSLAGICAGLLPVIRPTAALFAVAGFAFVIRAERGRAGWFAAGLAAGIAPGLAWNLAVFHTLAGGYAANARAFGPDLQRAATAFAALLVSPNRGLFAFCPVLLFAFPGAVRAARSRTAGGTLLAGLGIACLLLTVTYAFFDYWWAGITYGPRFLTDTAAIAGLLLLYSIPTAPLGRAAFGVAAFASLVVQFAGANGGAAGSEWNTVPVSIDFAPGRAWELRDGQIERNVRGAYYRFAPPAPAGPIDARIVDLTFAPASAPDGSPWLAARAVVRDAGSTVLYGYTTGRYAGQVRVSVRLYARSDGAPLGEHSLFLADSVGPGASGTATGVMRAPGVPFRAEAVAERI